MVNENVRKEVERRKIRNMDKMEEAIARKSETPWDCYWVHQLENCTVDWPLYMGDRDERLPGYVVK